MPRAYGSNAQLLGAIESVYGTPPAGLFVKLPFISSNLGSVQGLIDNDVLGYGRDPQAPIRDVINNDGDVVVPVDVRNFGVWLTALLGVPTTTANAASGFIRFASNPANNSTITINGTTFTFVTGTPTGDEILIGESLDATLAAAVTALNASVDEDVSLATYSHITGSYTLDIVHDTPGATGNTFTLAASAATVSGTTLTGGDAKLHTFVSGLDDLPSLSLEIGLSQVPAYFMNTGVRVDAMSLEFVRSGGAKATFSCIAQGETKYASSQGGTPNILTFQRFNQFQGSIKKDGLALGNVTKTTVKYSNNTEKIENIRDDGMIDGADPTIASLTGTMDVRFASTALIDIATAGSAVALEFAYTISNSKKLILTAHEVYLPKPKVSIEGPGGIQNTYDWQAAYNSSAAKMMTVKLINDVVGYS